MTTAVAHLFPLDACLVSRLGDTLLALSPEELAEAWVVLPTERLGTRLLAHLAARRVAFFPPRIFTLATFLRALAPHPTGVSACAPHALDFLIRTLLDQHAYRHVMPGHERELRLVFEEMQAACIGDEALPALAAALQEDVYKNADEMGSLAARLLEIHDVFQRLRGHLAAVHRCTETQMFRALTDAAAAVLAEGAPRPWGSLWMVGFTSAVKATEPFLAALCAEPTCRFWFTWEDGALPAHAPFAELVRFVTAAAGRVVREEGDGTRAAPAPIRLLEAEGPLEEVHAAVRRCEELMAQGCDPARLAILVTDEGLYGPCLRILEEGWGFKANLALPQSLLTTAAGRHLSAFLRCFENGETNADFFAWLLSRPPRDPADEAMGASFGLEARLWLADALRAGLLEDAKRLADAAPPLPDGHPLAARLAAAGPFLTRRHEKLPFGHWLALLKDYAQVMLRVGDEAARAEEDEAEGMAREQVDALLADLERFAALAPKPMPLPDFCRMIREKLGEMEVRGIGEPLAGLQVLSLPEARHMPFQHVVILGLNEGSFPKAIPADELLDDHLKRRLGLPGWQALEAMEDVTFSLLISRLPSFDLTRAETVARERAVRSRFIERLAMRRTVRVKRDAASPWWADGDGDAALGEGAGDEGVAGRALADYFIDMSASALEKLLACPYRFLLHQLGVERVRLASTQDLAMREGEWQHAVLEALVSGRSGRLKLSEGLDLTAWAASPDPVGFIHERLNDLTVKLAPQDFLDDPRSVSLMNISWGRYARHLDDLRRLAGPHAALAFMRELRLAHRPMLAVGGIERRVKGRIDAVDRMGRLAVITDFKKNMVPSPKETEDGSAPQLTFYALAMSGGLGGIPLDDQLVGYWSIRKGEWHPRAVGQGVKDLAQAAGLVKERTPDLATACAVLSERWLRQEAFVVTEAKRFVATPGPHCQRCDYTGICRVKPQTAPSDEEAVAEAPE